MLTDKIISGGKGAAEAAENRDYLTSRMTGELLEIIRVLQLTTYDEDEWEADNITVMRKALNIIEGKFNTAHDWLQVSFELTTICFENIVYIVNNYYN